jgi:hypothetical protein
MDIFYDYLNNQFKFYYYLKKFNDSIIDYLNNNNIDLDFYCCAAKVIDDNHYIITSNTNKNKICGYKLITINTNECHNNSNQIVEQKNSIKINFEDLVIYVCKITSSESDINDKISMYGMLICDSYINDTISMHVIQYDFDGSHDGNYMDFDRNWYDKNISELIVLHINGYYKLSGLYMFQNLKKLFFNKDLNQLIDCHTLPESLEELYFGDKYNQLIKVNVLPQSLKIISFTGVYNQPFGIGVLPQFLKKLSFNGVYNQPFGIGVLPQSLKKLSIIGIYNKPFGSGVLPVNIKRIDYWCWGCSHESILKLFPPQHAYKVKMLQ